MPLYLADKKATLFKGEHKPVSLYLGGKKVTGYEYAEQTSEHLTFENTYNDTASVVINGKSEQVQTEQGKNLFDMNRYHSDYVVDNTITYTQADFVAIHNIFADFNFKANTQYTFSCDYRVESTDLEVGNGISLEFLNENKERISATLIHTGSSGLVTGNRTLTNSANTTIRYFRFSYTTSTRNCTVTLSNIQLELGSTATDYEPFVPNSPSPEYPSPIKSVGGDGGFVLVSAGKNLAQTNTLTLDGTQPSNGIVFSGISPANTVFHFVKKEESVAQPTAALFRIVFIDDTFEYVTGRHTQTAILIKPVKEIKCLNWSGIVGTIDNIQLELGSSATPYTPFRGMQTINFPYTLRSLPDGTCDYIEINHKDKTAQFVKNIDTVALDWNKNWRKHNGGDLWLGNMVAFNNFSDYNFLFSKSPHVQCTHFELLPNTSYYYYSENVGFIGSTSWIGFKFFASDLGITSSTTTETAIALFQSWLEQQSLAGNPVTMQYALTNPVITELDYEAVKTYYPYTQIYTTATVQPTLKGKFRVWGS